MKLIKIATIASLISTLLSAPSIASEIDELQNNAKEYSDFVIETTISPESIRGVSSNLDDSELLHYIEKLSEITNIEQPFVKISRVGGGINLLKAENKSGDIFFFNDKVDEFIFNNNQYKKFIDIILPVDMVNKIIENQKLVAEKLEKNNSLFAKFDGKKDSTVDETIYVFADYSCPYCKSLFKDIDLINKIGITVYFVPFLNAGKNDIDGVKTTRKILCSSDMKAETMLAMNDPKKYAENAKNSEMDCPASFNVLKLLSIPDNFNVEGTPTTVLSNGYLFAGYTGMRDYVGSLALGVLEGNKIKKVNSEKVD